MKYLLSIYANICNCIDEMSYVVPRIMQIFCLIQNVTILQKNVYLERDSYHKPYLINFECDKYLL